MNVFRERRRGFVFVLLMAFAGLASGVITAAVCDDHFSYGLGIYFGVIVAFCLALAGVTRSVFRLASLVALVSCAFVFSVLLTEMLQIMAGERFVGTVEKNHLIALFIGGMLGGFIIIRGSRILCKADTALTATAWDAFWSLILGALSPIGWWLGPTLGMLVWRYLHAVDLTSATNTFSKALSGETGYGPPSRLYSLFVVWQMGTGFALGTTLQNVRERREMSSSDQLKLT